jgi:dTDP-4-dehydrorhamnose 3,5-epimerase
VTFTPLALAGACLVEAEPHADERGFYARTFCAEEFRRHGLSDRLVQCGFSYNRNRGTIRGMHRQVSPWAQDRLVRCSRGAIYDVIIDLRPGSATYRRWLAVELTAARPVMLYVPEGFAHGFQTLEDETEVFYQMSEAYHRDAEQGVRWNDPGFAIAWPIENPTLSDKDRAYRDFQP